MLFLQNEKRQGGGEMKKILFALCVCWGVVTHAADTIKINQQPVNTSNTSAVQQQHDMSLLFVINAERGVISNNRLELENVSDAVIYFSDRPQRMAGHIGLASFLKSWNKSADSFAADPPNAAVSITEDGKAFNTIVVELMNPTLAGKKLAFQIKIIQGAVPVNGSIPFTNDPLFIDGGFPCFISGC
jgi:hypothetical protein